MRRDGFQTRLYHSHINNPKKLEFLQKTHLYKNFTKPHHKTNVPNLINEGCSYLSLVCTPLSGREFDGKGFKDYAVWG